MDITNTFIVNEAGASTCIHGDNKSIPVDTTPTALTNVINATAKIPLNDLA